MTGFDLSGLLGGLLDITWQQMVMVGVGLFLIYLGIFKNYEPNLLIPIGFGCILGNLPVSANMIGPEGFFGVLYKAGISNELFPLLIFLGVGAMLDLRPLLSQPIMFIMGALAHLGIFATLVVSLILGFNLPESTAIGMIGAIDGPTVIYVNGKLGALFQNSWSCCCNSRHCLLLYEPRAHHPTSIDASIHNKSRARNPDGIYPTACIQNDRDPLPHCDYHHWFHLPARGCAPYRHPDAWKPDQGIRCRGRPGRNGKKHHYQYCDHFPRNDDRIHDAGSAIS